jgi:serine/threonine-protein kinase
MADDLLTLGSAAQTVDEVLTSTPYRPIRLLGRGGMGEVHLIEHRFLGARFALKIPRAELATDPQLADRMRIEAQAAARLRHPNIVEIVDFWIASDGRPCVVMEYLRGHTLRNELSVRGRLGIDETLEFSSQALSALAAAHRVGVVHRDIKPDNLFLQEMASGARVLKVLDFGVARVYQMRPGWHRRRLWRQRLRARASALPAT